MRAVLVVLMMLWTSLGQAADPSSFLDRAIDSSEPKYPVVEYAVCTASAQTAGVVMVRMDTHKARAYFNQAVACLDEKFPAAIAEAEGHPDLIAALKEHYVYAMAWAKALGTQAHRPAFDAAFQRVKMEATIAKKWKPAN